MPRSLCPQEAKLLHSFPPPCSFQPLSLGSQSWGEVYQTLLPPLDQLAPASCLLPSALASVPLLGEKKATYITLPVAHLVF